MGDLPRPSQDSSRSFSKTYQDSSRSWGTYQESLWAVTLGSLIDDSTLGVDTTVLILTRVITVPVDTGLQHWTV